MSEIILKNELPPQDGLDYNKDVVISCEACRAELMIYKQVYREVIGTYLAQAKCCYCGGQSKVLKIPMGSQLSGYFRMKPDNDCDTIDLTRYEYHGIVTMEEYDEDVVIFDTFVENKMG